MTMFIQLVNGVPVGAPIVEENMKYILPPDVEMPTIVTPAFIEQYGYGIYEWTMKPDPGEYKKAIEITPVKALNGIYYQTWDTVDMSPGEIAQYEAAEKDNVRAERNRLLIESDWTQLKDAPLTPEKMEEWSQYRQALRDITSQPAFPTGVVWPTTPSNNKGVIDDPDLPAGT